VKSDLLHALDPAAFASDRLGFVPDDTQKRALQSESKRVLLNCTRQWGKSTVTAVKAVHRVLGLVRQMRATVLHLRDAGIGSCGCFH
jgi:hypothetical protein